MDFHILKKPFRVEHVEINAFKQFFEASSAVQSEFRFKSFDDYEIDLNTELLTFVYPPTV